jgi:hypothetical protein
LSVWAGSCNYRFGRMDTNFSLIDP